MLKPSDSPRKPRLSLQIKAISNGPSVRSSRTLAAAADPKSPTSFNTLSNIYVTAIERSSSVQPEPLNASTSKPPSLRIQTQDGISGGNGSNGSKNVRLQTPYLGPYLDTPQSAHPLSPTVTSEVRFPSAMTATPPLSAGVVDNPVFTFSAPSKETVAAGLPSPKTPRRRTAFPTSMTRPPYSHPRSLHSILRNSPLPSAKKSPGSPRRESLRLQEKAAKRVAYNNPLEQTITTNKYTKSHIDLLCEEATPLSPYKADEDPEKALAQVMASTRGSETRDGGQTPGTPGGLGRRLASLKVSSPVSRKGGVQRRGVKKDKRQWVWTIGTDDAEDPGSPVAASDVPTVSVPKVVPAVPVIAVPAPRPRSRQNSTKAVSLMIPVAPPRMAPSLADGVPGLVRDTPTSGSGSPPSSVEQPPTPSVDSVMSSQETVFESKVDDVEMSDSSSMLSDATDEDVLAMEVDSDQKTPLASIFNNINKIAVESNRLGSVDQHHQFHQQQPRDAAAPETLKAATFGVPSLRI